MASCLWMVLQDLAALLFVSVPQLFNVFHLIPCRHFFFESRANSRGAFMRIKEVSGGMKNLLVVPMNAIAQFQVGCSNVTHNDELTFT